MKKTYIRRNDIFGILFCILLISLFCVYVVWNSTPGIDIPSSANRSTPVQESDIVCGSSLCSYYRDYETTMEEKDVSNYYIERGWICRIIDDDQDIGIFNVQKPYWQCDGPAFPKGKATIGIYHKQSFITSNLRISVSWDV